MLVQAEADPASPPEQASESHTSHPDPSAVFADAHLDAHLALQEGMGLQPELPMDCGTTAAEDSDAPPGRTQSDSELVRA